MKAPKEQDYAAGESVDPWYRCGNVSCRLAPNSIGPILVDGREVIRRIFVTVRDGSWQEIAPDHYTLDALGPGKLLIGGEHRSTDIDFSWAGELRIEPTNNEIGVSISGQVLRDGRICRLGLIVLLPPELVQGATGSIVSEGHQAAVAFGRELGPQPIVEGWPAGLTAPFEAIELTNAEGSKIALAFEGESFELEDQRNWGDASFKIYCTPLARGFPRSVGRGERVTHSVSIRYAIAADSKADASDQPAVTIAAARPFPSLGVEAAALSGPAGGLPWRHIAVDAATASVGTIPNGSRVELVLGVGGLEGDWADVLQHKGDRLQLCRVLLCGSGQELPTDKALGLCRRLLAKADIPVLAATKGWFVEFNRSVDLPSPCDGYAWPVAPAVHCADIETLLENCAPFGAMSDHLRSVRPVRMAIARLSLGVGETVPFAEADRSAVILWLRAAMIDAARAGIESVTLASSLADYLGAAPEGLAELSRLVDLSDVPVEPLSGGEGLLALLVTRGPRTQLLAGNVGRSPAKLVLPGIPPAIRVIPPRTVANFAVDRAAVLPARDRS